MDNSVIKVTVKIENYVHKTGGNDRFNMYKRVRCTTENGETRYFKELVVPGFLNFAMMNKKFNTLYVVDLNKGKAHCLVAYQNDMTVKYDPDELSDIAAGFKRSGLFFWLGGTLASVLSLIAYGLGIILFPIVLYMGWVYFVRIPAALNSQKIADGLRDQGFPLGGMPLGEAAQPKAAAGEWLQ
ncbi:TPA: hypothetical protein QDZ12_006044 [Pseudomonas putida]|uniref:hypothetical protein n=1 Tax=Pseudomonas sp. HD6515 TaxID=2856556 RepID=UPI00217E12E3|nr:hypothetical protein [Pseudomonas sp. HD6515]ELS0924339.1 hypothetical protein [Pseudomonas putida]UWH21908.1 hypothetical protein KW568_23470 [Pseudomonas sp. HD6515]HDS0942675.1 hypothetical protein [Pseudomonas putida]